MTSRFSQGDLPDLGSALELFEQEQAKLADFQQKLAETSTVVDSRNRMLTVTLDGSGELSDLKFNTTAYRTMAPAELSALILETLRKARSQSFQTMQELMGGGPLQGLDIEEIATGQADLAAVLGKVMGPSLEAVQEAGGIGAPKRTDDTDDDGWER
ncbi:YbaB/EbfC family nucleoid-associated protein [Saccharopolyspora sp. K220]|uniref:YbaB/EbfC family nucleoid-associated protein n=1 Tax=Saccharopolyspora soli TaxID=2926618 RepID=UPI001F58C307|nr:YbaB/EbfC family nucleoid-associated protein [Saccharopolyspora soli]MCI2417470.1 YbaB/EbfC family nucleoid-associated protein [Saccharopolyspora soli]